MSWWCQHRAKTKRATTSPSPAAGSLMGSGPKISSLQTAKWLADNNPSSLDWLMVVFFSNIALHVHLLPKIMSVCFWADTGSEKQWRWWHFFPSLPLLILLLAFQGLWKNSPTMGWNYLPSEEVISINQVSGLVVRNVTIHIHFTGYYCFINARMELFTVKMNQVLCLHEWHTMQCIPLKSTLVLNNKRYL